MATLFISYKRDDKVAVTKISDRLKKEYYYDIWIDAVSIPGGEDWRAEIRKGIDKADVVLLMLTPDACASVQVKEEIDYAKSVGRKIMPLQIKHVTPDDQKTLGVAHLNYIDFLASHDDRFAWEKLLNDLPPVLNRNKRLLDPNFSKLHRLYLRSLFTRYGKLSLSYLLDATPKERVNLFDVYVPLFLGVLIWGKVKDKQLMDWWVSNSREELGDKPKARSKTFAGMDVDPVVLNRLIERIRIFIERDNISDGEESLWRLESEEAPALVKHLVITGAPGSGKSTLLKHLALCMAGDMLHEGEEAQADLNKLGFWTLPAYTPIFVELRGLVRTSFSDSKEVVTLEKFFSYIKTEQLNPYSIPEYLEGLQDQMADGDVMIFLDGLDEVPDADKDERREQIKTLVNQLSEQYPQCRICVTSRPYAYAGDWRLDGFGQATLANLDTDRLEELALRLFRVVLGQEGTEQEAEAFKVAVEKVPKELSRSPLFFTLMASIWLNNLSKPADKRLPVATGDIYRECVEMLIHRWKRVDANSGLAMLDEIGLSESQLRQVLETLAYQIHSETGDKDDADFRVSRILDVLEDLDLAEQVKLYPLKDALAQRAGIIYERAPKHFQYAHRSFQEHLVACYLVGEGRYPQQIVAELRKSPALWRNVMELIPDEAKRQGRDLWALVKALLPDKNAPLPTDPTDSLWECVYHAVQLMTKHLPQEDDLQEVYRTRLQKPLIGLIECGGLVPVERAEMGRMLSEIGDTRAGVGVMTAYKIPLPDMAWCLIPAGELIMGSDEHRNNEKPAHTLHLDDFYMSRYLVTYAQYQAFENAPDFGHDDWWEGFPEDEKRVHYDQYFQHANHPRETITWYGAVVFCRWVTHHMNEAKLPMRVWDMTSKTYLTKPHQEMKITLPSEAEYEKMARGTDGRIYPYGNDFDATKGNTSDTGISMTSAVGMFPGGESPYGVLDASGNVWTWTRSLLKDYKYNSNDGREDGGSTDVRILRGGSWFIDSGGARASYRIGGDPLGRFNSIGFFVVCCKY